MSAKSSHIATRSAHTLLDTKNINADFQIHV